MKRHTSGISPVDAMLLLCVVVWSANVSFVKILLDYWSPFSLATVRMSLALLGFAVVLLIREGSVRIARRDMWRVVAAGAAGIFANQVCFVYALTDSHASSVALLLAMIPVFIALISAAFRLERLTFWAWMGLPVSLLGVTVIVVSEPGTHLSLGSIQGNLFALGTALSWAAYTILLQPLLKTYSVARISFWVIVVGLVGLLVPGILELNPSRSFGEPWWDWLFVLYSSVGAIFLTNFLWYLGTHRLGPARGSIYAFLQPFLGVIMAVLIVRDSANPIEVVGGAIIIAGILISRRGRVRIAVP